MMKINRRGVSSAVNDTALTAPQAQLENDDKKKGIYIHIPFCVRKCIYCDFTSYPECSEVRIEEYFRNLKEEARILTRKNEITCQGADSIFIGGGTPTCVDARHISDILSVLEWDEDCEITIESNPATLTAEKLACYRLAGINRLSMGVQSFNDDELVFLGRIHSSEDTCESFRMAREAGFDNINLDLIFGFPGQTLKSWESSLRKALELRPEHISFYSLQIEEGTLLYDMFRKDQVEQIPDEVNRQMYHLALDLLRENGYVHYEISNAALPGRECRHNLKYWTMVPYNGLGAGAHSFEDGWRFFNPDSLEGYKESVEEKCMTEDLKAGSDAVENSPDENLTDMIFTGMRLIKGLDLKKLELMTGSDLLMIKGDFIEESIREGFLEIIEGKLRFTSKGLDLSNHIIGQLMP